MPSCIYCTKEHEPTGEHVHVFPEALVANDVHLPTGAVCQPCNNYCGHELDAVVAQHPLMALAIQFLQLSGKRGPRKTIGGVQRLKDGSIAIELPDGHVTRTPDGARVSIWPENSFNFGRFRRGIHHIAFNLFAHEAGVDLARRSHFDPVRDYVKQPKPNEAWTLVQRVEPLTHVRPIVQGRRIPEAPGEVVLLRLFNADFYVDLLNRGALAHWAQRELGREAIVIAPEWTPPKAARLGKRRFRIRLVPPGSEGSAT